MNNKAVLLLILLSLCCSCTKEIQTETLQLEHPDHFIKAAHYFSNAWPKTFWQEFEAGNVSADLERIKSDGFNTIILVLPWRGFESGFDEESTTSNPRMYARFRFLLDEIKKKQLSYILRLGFPHDFTPDTGAGIVSLCSTFYQEPRRQSQWLDYLGKVKQVTDEHSANLSGVLVSWEDFWCPHFVFPYMDENQRRELAQRTGYADWLMSKNEALLKIMLGQNDIDVSKIAIPMKDDMVYFYYLEFVDQQFNNLVLATAKSVFPQAAMEIRIDKDPVVGAGNDKIWVGHDLHLDEVNHRGTYWAPFWGAANNGEKLSLERTLFNFEYFLNYVTSEGESVNHVIEQFNFTDNTPYFPNNAAIAEDSVDDFLAAAAPLLKKYSMGYGVWAYSDYADNALFNASFEFDLDGWDTGGRVEVIGDDSDHELRMDAGASISQIFQPHERFMLATAYRQLDLCLSAQGSGSIEIHADDELVKSVILSAGHNCFQVESNKLTTGQDVKFRLTALSPLTLDEIKLYGFVQRLGLNDEFGQPGPYLQAIREMNLNLDN